MKNSLTEISRCLVAIDSAVARRRGVVDGEDSAAGAGEAAAESAGGDSSSSVGGSGDAAPGARRREAGRPDGAAFGRAGFDSGRRSGFVLRLGFASSRGRSESSTAGDCREGAGLPVREEFLSSGPSRRFVAVEVGRTWGWPGAAGPDLRARSEGDLRARSGRGLPSVDAVRLDLPPAGPLGLAPRGGEEPAAAAAGVEATGGGFGFAPVPPARPGNSSGWESATDVRRARRLDSPGFDPSTTPGDFRRDLGAVPRIEPRPTSSAASGAAWVSLRMTGAPELRRIRMVMLHFPAR